jgi:hypothetical protein
MDAITPAAAANQPVQLNGGGAEYLEAVNRNPEYNYSPPLNPPRLGEEANYAEPDEEAPAVDTTTATIAGSRQSRVREDLDPDGYITDGSAPPAKDADGYVLDETNPPVVYAEYISSTPATNDATYASAEGDVVATETHSSAV